MNLQKLLAKLEGLDDRCAEFVAADIVNEVSEWAARNGYPDLVREWTPAAQPIEVRKYLAEAIAATRSEHVEVPTDALIDLVTAGELLGYKPAGLRKVVKAGHIRFVQNGNGPIKFRREWIDEYLQANNPTGLKRSPSQRKPPSPEVTIPGFDPSRFKG